MNAPSDTASLAALSEGERVEAQRLMAIENGRRDVRANLFLAAMVGLGALTVLAVVAVGGSGGGTATTPGANGSVSAAR